MLSLIAFFAVIGGSAVAAISDSEPPPAPPASTQPADEAVPTDEIPVPAGLVQEQPVDPATEPAETPPATEPAKTPPPQREANRRAPKPKHTRDDARGDDESSGPPAWAPAHGYRCKRAGNAPGSAAFHDCIKSRKKQNRAKPHSRH